MLKYMLMIFFFFKKLFLILVHQKRSKIYKLYLILIKKNSNFLKSQPQLRYLAFPKKLININVNDVVDKFFKPFAFCIIKVFLKII